MSPSLAHAGIWAGFILAAHLLYAMPATASRVCKGPVVSLQMSTASGSCLCPLPRVISEPSGMGSDVAIHLELYRAENPTASGWPVIGLRINLYLRTKKLPW